MIYSVAVFSVALYFELLYSGSYCMNGNRIAVKELSLHFPPLFPCTAPKQPVNGLKYMCVSGTCHPVEL